MEIALLSIVVLLIPDLTLGGALNGNLIPFSGGFTWQSALGSVWEETFAVSMSLGLLTWFREKRNHQTRLDRRLTEDAFAVYVFFPPILVGVALLMAPAMLPSLLKFSILAVVGTITSFGLAEFVFRRIPGLRSVL